MSEQPGQSRVRLRELQCAWRIVSWHVLRRAQRDTLSRRTWLKLAAGHVRCGVVTGGKHWWGPLRAEYAGQLRRRRKCRLCGAKMIPGSEIARTPPTPEQVREGERMFQKPTEEDVRAAVESARRAGLLKGDKWLWD